MTLSGSLSSCCEWPALSPLSRVRQFSAVQVPATVLQPGVLRATVPPHPPGLVRVAVSLGDGIPRSRPLPFEYRVPPPAQLSDDEQ